MIVLSGIDNGLRRQTNSRLKRELVGDPDDRPGAVRLPPMGRQWHEFTRDDLHGDFQPGFANHAALQGSQPVLLVVKKNGPVLRRLLRWLDEAPVEVRRTLPFLLIDDEADQASVDTRGTYQAEDEPPDPDYEPPSVINGLIRDLLQHFERRAMTCHQRQPMTRSGMTQIRVGKLISTLLIWIPIVRATPSASPLRTVVSLTTRKSACRVTIHRMTLGTCTSMPLALSPTLCVSQQARTK